jgi:nigerose phosphorylase
MSEPGAEWRIVETGAPNKEAAERLGKAFLLGNGFMGCRGTLEEYSREHKTATIVSGLYDRVGSQWREPVNLPNGGFVQFLHGGVPLHADSEATREHAHVLDMRRAAVFRRTVFSLTDGTAVTLRSMRFVSLCSLHLICMQMVLEAGAECALLVRTAIDGDVWDLNGPHLRDMKGTERDGVVTLSAGCSEKGAAVAVSEITAAPVAWSFRAAEKSFFREAAVTVGPDSSFSLVRIVSVRTALDSVHPSQESREDCLGAAETGILRLFAEHSSAWEQRWEAADVSIHGDAEAQRALRFSTYHVMAMAPTHSDFVSIPARGLSSQVYKGAVFWDTEIFMLPFFLSSMPQVARNLLLYRFRTLDGARRKAREYGYRGAFYAWESQDTGDDACTLFNVTDVLTGRPLRTYFRDKQYHISADVAYALWKYYEATGDGSIFVDGGAEVIFECARFFLSLLYYKPGKDRYELLDATGPDEYHERVHNNAFTNAMVAHTFDLCCRTAEEMQRHHPDQLRSLMDRLEYSTDLASIRSLRARLYVPPADPRTLVMEQFDGYFALEDVAPESLLQRKLHPHEYLGGGNGIATQTQVIKQADVVLAAFLLDFPRNVKEANWRYYEPRTEHGSSLSACAYGIVGAEIGETARAYDYFMETATIDLCRGTKQYVGSLYIDGTHAAANASAWNIVVAGFCGIRFTGTRISVDPRLPAQWQEVSVPLIFRGRGLRITVRHDCVDVSVSGPPPENVTVEIEGKTLALKGEGLHVPVEEERWAGYTMRKGKRECGSPAVAHGSKSP